MRMHGYYSERMVATSPSLADLAPIVGMHHERLDGSGYHRAARRPHPDAGARLVAVADAFAAMLQPRPHRAALDGGPGRRRAHRRDRGGPLRPRRRAAVLAEAGHAPGRRRHRPAGLSDREVEVLG